MMRLVAMVTTCLVGTAGCAALAPSQLPAGG